MVYGHTSNHKLKSVLWYPIYSWGWLEKYPSVRILRPVTPLDATQPRARNSFTRVPDAATSGRALLIFDTCRRAVVVAGVVDAPEWWPES